MYVQPIPLSLFAPTCSPEIEKLVRETHGFISYLSEKGAPDPSDYFMLNTILQCFSGDKSKSMLSEDHFQRIRGAFGEALSPDTIQGWAYHKPLGYAGDFQIIEKYTRTTPLQTHIWLNGIALPIIKQQQKLLEIAFRFSWIKYGKPKLAPQAIVKFSI